MTKLAMKGPFEFTAEDIDKVVDKKSIGNYILGYAKNKIFFPKYVGRSDKDLNQELKDKLDSKYDKFEYCYALSLRDSFEGECDNYHNFLETGLLDNENHPDRPNSTDLKCPRCDNFDKNKK